MHKHLKSNCIGQNQKHNIASPPAPILPPVIRSTASIEVVGSGYAFRGWNYATGTVCFMLGKIPLHTDVTSLYCIDIGYGITLVDRAWLFEKAAIEKILKIAALLKVKGIGSLRHELDEFVFMSLYFLGIDSTNRPAYAYIHKELYIVEGLKASWLVGNDILATERVIIDLANKSTMISSCQVTISIAARPRGHPVQRKVLVD